jgi:hypothetical protein
MIEFDAVVFKVSTLVDQGLRVTLDLPETALIAAAQLMAAKREGLNLHLKVEIESPITPMKEQGKIDAMIPRKSVRSG